MSAKKKEKLLPSSLSELVERFQKQDVVAEMEKRYQSAPTRLIPTDLIDDNTYIGEVVFAPDVISGFAEQLRTRGIYNPLVLKRKGDRYELILGRKRLFGAKAAGIISLPAVIAEIGEEEELLTLLADNRDQRESNILEMALVCSALQRDFGYEVNTLAKLSHQSRSQIANTLRLLKLPTELRNKLNRGELSYGHARAIACLDQDQAIEAAEKITEGKLSVRQTESLVRSLRQKSGSVEALNEQLSSFGGEASESKKEVRFRFSSEEDKERFIAAFLEK